uniref:NAA-35 n=1 Tax=Mus musculus TaxID=10090 RepID=C9K103_MOUSE|nr:NAA-35 [Mus musculus]
MSQAEELFPLSPCRRGTVEPPRAESIFKSSKHTTAHSQALSFPEPQGTGCPVRGGWLRGDRVARTWGCSSQCPAPPKMLLPPLWALPVSSVLTHSPS